MSLTDLLRSPVELHSPMQDDDSSHLGFDGTQDRKSFHKRDPSTQHDAHDFFRQRKQTSRPPSDTCVADHEPVNADAPADPNHMRRKRRRITPANQTSLTAFISERIENNQEPRADSPELAQDAIAPPPCVSNGSLALQALPGQDVAIINPASTIEHPQAISDNNQDPERNQTNRSTPRKRTPKKAVSLLQALTGEAGTTQDAGSLVLDLKAKSAISTLSRRNMKMKNGRFVQSFELVLKYGQDQASRTTFGGRIDNILASTQTSTATSKTHPFFSNRAKAKTIHIASDGTIASRNDDTDQEGTSTAFTKNPIAWSDIKFSNVKNAAFKSVDAVRAIWPPSSLQHVGRDVPDHVQSEDVVKLMRSTKRKTKDLTIGGAEDVLHSFAKTISSKIVHANILMPKRLLLSGDDLVHTISQQDTSPSTSSLDSKAISMIQHGTGAFDKGEPSRQQSWNTKYAPCNVQDVLQPSCHILRDWLKSLAVHNVQSGGLSGEKRDIEKPSKKRRRPKKSNPELDDFIVDDDDDDMQQTHTFQNAVLITGPSGCGKTASVFAVAKEMDFEVFEIHPGMRRSAKDIFDKVGDMTQNHLVQGKDGASRSSSVAPCDPEAGMLATDDKLQSSLVGFLGSKGSRTKMAAKDKPTSNTTAKKEQKQSLILFEEVDILFESDKAFWSGVQNLIQQSKRPVVMTCNDISQIPISELDLYTVLEYQKQDVPTATSYLTAMCASEGHIVSKEAIRNLYLSKDSDLRASIAEVNFWCQMTVGSENGGLDWMFSSVLKEPRHNARGDRMRICSEGTYHSGLDLLPVAALDLEQTMRQCSNDLELPVSTWLEMNPLPSNVINTAESTDLFQLDLLKDYYDTRSVQDNLDNNTATLIASMLMAHNTDRDIREQVTSMVSSQVQHSASLRTVDIVDAFDALTIEKPVFPPSQGRLAPSIDACSTLVAVDVAPYVRSIVSYDQQLEQQRDEMFGSQGKKSRHTRAARAAAEGGDKAYTRADRWFPRQLDFERVMETGNGWPQWLPDDGGDAAVPAGMVIDTPMND